jgi:hypothetical protein
LPIVALKSVSLKEGDKGERGIDNDSDSFGSGYNGGHERPHTGRRHTVGGSVSGSGRNSAVFRPAPKVKISLYPLPFLLEKFPS